MGKAIQNYAKIKAAMNNKQEDGGIWRTLTEIQFPYLLFLCYEMLLPKQRIKLWNNLV